ncbi:centromere/kinetochore protein zw10 homolog isoform X2 [Syngnathus typhle]|uniref:centromere/kinetochore protein zw10 homolog isoform X2 n=1 Tax=Syngnathus typhle TaxID=161592 RepID=UPI002A6B3294|nr:centromere/kinetochore protein zw10 homolog isoform X2 [Syngnathus typhle]
MASFVAEVLASSGKLEKEDLSGKISKMSRKIEDTKVEICGMLNSRYSDFLPSLHASEDLMVQVDDVSKEMDTLKRFIETEVQQNLHASVAEYTKLKQQLEKNTIIITMLGHLKYFDNAMEEFNKGLQKKQYVDAALQLQRAKTSVESLKSWKATELSLISALSSELTVQRENLVYHLGDEWKRLVIWNLPPLKDPAGVDFFPKVELCLCLPCEEDERPEAPAVLQALAIQGDLHHKIKLFMLPFCLPGQVLLKNMLKPAVLHPSLSVLVSEQRGKGIVLTFERLQDSHEERSTPSQVYCKLLLVLRTLYSNLLNVTIGDQKLSTILGKLIWEELSRCIIHGCLLYSIPTDSSQLEKYNIVIKETEEFEKALKEMEFLRDESTDLLKYARDVNCHFASKKCKDVMVAARQLMTAKMHNTVKITAESEPRLAELPVPDSLPQVKREAPSEEGASTLENTGRLSVRLPPCCISESVQQLMLLAVDTLGEAVGSSTQCASQLFFTVRNIFQLFHDVVPTYHKENLLKFPHLAAIQHNNCMYLAHHLLTLGHHFRPHLPRPLSQGVTTFVDMVPAFRKLGAQCFLTQLNIQRAELLERLSTARNFCNLDDADNYAAASKAVRQVIHQLKQLGTVWQDVLPVGIYCKAMGNLLNTTVAEMIAKIMMLEDISSKDGEHLHILCQMVIKEGPLVFVPLTDEHKNKKYQEEVPLYAKKWSAFKELVVVLCANLQELVDRWADAKGPLALEFTGTEVRSLIRALFQNTERRALAMTKIK